MEIKLHNIHKDSYKRQHNFTLYATIDIEGEDIIIGILEYVLFEGGITISIITVDEEHRRKGVGSRMFNYMVSENPEYTYKPSLKTELGSLFRPKPEVV